MAYPPFEEYQEALRASPHETFTDPVLASGQVVRKRSGEPLALSGNFALTYQVVSANRRYAVRCFHKFGDALPQRYEAITRRLAEMPSPYFVDCEFQPGGIRTESGWYPLVRMDWVDGPTLGAFVADHYADAVTMQQLRASLRVLARQLAALGIAHGDIQPGNIVVRGATDVSLIDYDGMFVPELATLGSIELGQRNFQHPGRRWRHYHARLDGFSFAVMDVALGALAYRPELWNDARCDESAFVFRAEDFIEPYASAAFGWVSEIPGLEVKAQYLAAICQSPFDETPGIEDFLAGRAIPVPRVRVSSQPFRTHRPRYLPAFPVVDAANFAQACAHVGDRAELIGRIRRSRVAGVTLADGGWIRIEFGAFPDDMAALHMHTTAAATEAAIDGLRQGEWISAIGLVEPPHVERIEDHTCKVVTLQIDHHSQVTKLSASEARHRLAASARGASPGDDHAPERVGTDPAFPEPAVQTLIIHDPAVPERHEAAAIQPPAAPGPQQAVPDHEFRAGLRRRPLDRGRWAWVLGTMAALLLLVFAVRDARRAAPSAVEIAAGTTDRGATPVARGNAPTDITDTRRSTVDRSAPGSDHETAAQTRVTASMFNPPPALRRARPLRPRDLPIQTSLGVVSIVRRAGMEFPQVDRRTVDNVGAPALGFAHLADFGQRIVLTGFATCAANSTQCRSRAPFWLILRAGAEPRLVRSSGSAAAAASREIVALSSGIHVDLGVWDGIHRSAVLTSMGDPWLVQTAEPRQRLDRNQCLQALRALESCAAVRGCGSFAVIAAAIPSPRASIVRELFHETTGLNADGFRSVCVRSCQLGLTPTRSFVQQRVCGGADRGQWDRELL